MNARQCIGFPEGHTCPVTVRADRLYCQGCVLERQRFYASGLPHHRMTRVDVVLADFEAPRPACRTCGGDPTSPHHDHSLVHLVADWAERGLTSPAESA